MLAPRYTKEEIKTFESKGRHADEKDRVFTIIENGQIIFADKQYIVKPNESDFLFDAKNEKIYFFGYKLELNSETKELGGADNKMGIFVFDVKNKAFDEIRAEIANDNPARKTFIATIRVPKTPYLLYCTMRSGGRWANASKLGIDDIKGMECWILEIPQWQ
ncbi:MAG: hypothetical protein LBO62_04615 [Endomicrobium sp.]|jgi:hypothetical protein|nr:hypothetical protein [Endomicrobium sp.]